MFYLLILFGIAQP